MTLPTISPLPPAPSRQDAPAAFVPKADAFLGSLDGFRQQLNLYAAALPSAITGTDFSGNSTTSTLISTGSKTFTASTGKQWQIGQSVRVAYTTTPANYMDGQVTAYNSVTGSLTVGVTAVGGSGTFALWTISLLPGAGSFATLAGAETLSNKTLTAPVIATMVSGGFTLTVPAATDTLVGKATTDTLINKTIDTAGPNAIKINGNALAAAAGTATITFFNSSDTVVGRNTTDTLANKTLTAPTINGGTVRGDTVVSDGGTTYSTSVGFRGIPRSANVSGTLIATDNGKYVPVTANIAIPPNATLALPDGFACEIVNESSSPITVSLATDTLRWSGTSTTGNRTLAAYGRAAVGKRGAAGTTWYISGDIS